MLKGASTIKNKQQSHSRYHIVRNAIKKDLVQFAIPALLVFILGLMVSARHGYDGMTETIFNLLLNPRSFHQLSIHELVGLVIFILSLTFAIIAVFTLKTFYSSALVIRENHKLIKHGVYKFTRHPIYLGVLTICVIALPVYTWSIYSFLIMLILIPIFLNRIRIEENLLIEEFGDEYLKYRKTTKKLVPFIY